MVRIIMYSILIFIVFHSNIGLSQIQPHQSYYLAPVSNGLCVGVYDTKAGKLKDLFPHLYAEARPAKVTPDLLYDAYYGVYLGMKGTWFPMIPPIFASYENGTGILVVVREAFGLRFTERWFAPMHMEMPVLVSLLTVRNMSSEPIFAKLFSLHNFHVGSGIPEAGYENEYIEWADMFIEKGQTSNRMAIVKPLVKPTSYSASPCNPYKEMPKKGKIEPCVMNMTLDDIVSAFEWDIQINVGEETTVGIVMAVVEDQNQDEIVTAMKEFDRTPDMIVDLERKWWKDFHSKDILPNSLTPNQFALARQSLVTLVMSQVREKNIGDSKPNGQILASLPPGQWNRTWVRDQSYAAVALAVTGHVSEARAAVNFVLNAKTNYYQKEVGMPYLVSVCRYYGDGIEESDGSDSPLGPNIEFDGFGLFLWMIKEVIDKEGKIDQGEWKKVKVGVADVLIFLMEDNGLIRADSGIWEVHWNGFEKHFANTSITAVLGLCSASELAQMANDKDQEKYRENAKKIRDAIMKHLIAKDNILVGNKEEMEGENYFDAAVVEGFNFNVFPVDKEVSLSTLSAIREKLFMEKTGHGFMRNDDGGWYDRQEWVFIDLRMALAMRRAGLQSDAEKLIEWIVNQTQKNMDLFAELYSEDKADYEGAVPMAGFGAGAYLLLMVSHEPIIDMKKCLGTMAVIPEKDVKELLEYPETTPEATSEEQEMLKDIPEKKEEVRPMVRSKGCLSGGHFCEFRTLALIICFIMGVGGWTIKIK